MAGKKREAKFVITADNKTAGAFAKITGDLGKLGGKFSSFGKLAAGGLAAFAGGAAVRGIAGMIQRANDLTDSLRDSSIRLGIGISDLQAYQHAAGNAGIEAGKLEGILQKLNKASGEIKLGSGTDKQIAAFQAIGVTVDEIRKSDPASLFEQVVEGLGGISDPAERAALAMQIFGKSGAAVLTLVADGAESLRESRQLLDELGLSLTTLDGSKVDAANDALGTLSFVAEAAKQKLGAELSPAIVAVSEMLMKAGNDGTNFGDQISAGVSQAVLWVDRLIEGAQLIGNVFSASFNVVQGIFSSLGAEIAGFIGDTIDAFEVQFPTAINKMIEATEKGLTAMNQGFADFATAAANVVVAGMNKAISAIDTLVNGAAAALSGFIAMANQIPGVNLGSFSYSQTSAQIPQFSRFPVDRVNLGRLPVGEGATGSREVERLYREDAANQFSDAGTDMGQALDSIRKLASENGGDFRAAFEEATKAIEGTTAALDGEGGGSSGGSGKGGKGGTAGALDKVKKKAKETGKAIEDTFNLLEEYGKIVTNSLEKGIDDFVKNGKLSLSDFAASMLRDLAAITAKAAILGGILGNQQYGGNGAGLIGSLLSGYLSGFSSAPKAIAVGSYAGGGFTGMGARAGGIDGKGGFAAVLHPNETVVDHTQGQSSGGPVTVNQTVIVRETMPAGVARQISENARRAAVADMLNISQRGGSRRKQFAFG